jgi:hypothetical protein
MTLLEQLKSLNFGLTSPINPNNVGGIASQPTGNNANQSAGIAQAPNQAVPPTTLSGNYAPCDAPCGVTNISGCIQTIICLIEHMLLWVMYNILIILAILFGLWLMFGTHNNE